MKSYLDVAYGISGNIVRRGLTKVIEISITDGEDTWTFDTAESFTMRELKQRFPYFNHKVIKKKPKVLPGQMTIDDVLPQPN